MGSLTGAVALIWSLFVAIHQANLAICWDICPKSHRVFDVPVSKKKRHCYSLDERFGVCFQKKASQLLGSCQETVLSADNQQETNQRLCFFVVGSSTTTRQTSLPTGRRDDDRV